jgi:hypothetical protein
VILSAVWFAAPPARADVAVTGARDDVRIEVDNAAVEDVMDALGVNFGLRYRSTAPLARRISGTHRGALERIVARVLDGYDFVVKTGPEGIEVTVYGAVKPEDAQRQAKSVRPRHRPRQRKHRGRERAAKNGASATSSELIALAAFCRALRTVTQIPRKTAAPTPS